MTGFGDVRSIRVPMSKIQRTQDHLASMGRKDMEGMALWVGVHSRDIFEVREAVIPEQQGIRSDHGIAVAIAGAELHRLNLWLFRNKFRLIAQVHSHPSDAYHSDTDDQYAVATQVGSLSLVVPDFASNPFDLLACATYRLSASGKWVELRPGEVMSLITITG